MERIHCTVCKGGAYIDPSHRDGRMDEVLTRPCGGVAVEREDGLTPEEAQGVIDGIESDLRRG